jgi:hypothetical protein
MAARRRLLSAMSLVVVTRPMKSNKEPMPQKLNRPSGRSRRSNQLSKGSGQPFAPQHGQGSHAGRRATLCETGPLHSLQRGRSTPVDEISSATVDKLAVANSTELLLLHIEVGG